jgi:hypothetical protein
MFCNIVLTSLFIWLNFVVGRRNDKYVREKICSVPSYDLYISNFPVFLMEYHFLPDLLLVTNIVISCMFVEYKLLINSLLIFYLIRLLVIYSTVGYVSFRFYKMKNTESYLSNSLFTDLCISGHVGCSFIISLCICENNIIQSISLLISSLLAFVNLACGDHYSSDVILGIILSILITNCKLYT